MANHLRRWAHGTARPAGHLMMTLRARWATLERHERTRLNIGAAAFDAAVIVLIVLVTVGALLPALLWSAATGWLLGLFVANFTTAWRNSTARLHDADRLGTEVVR